MTSLDVAKRGESEAVFRSHSSDGGYQTSEGGSSGSSDGGSCQWVDLALDGEVGQPGWQNYWNQLRARWHPVYLFGWMPAVGSYWDKTEEQDYYVEEIPEVIEEVIVEERPEVYTDVIVKEVPDYTTCTILHPVEYSAVEYGSASTLYGKATRERKRKSRVCCACLPCCTWCLCCWLLLALLLLAAAAVPLILHLLKPAEGKDGDTVGRVAMDVTLYNNGSYTEDVSNTTSQQHKTLDSQLHREVKRVLEERLKEGYYNDSKLKSAEYREDGVNVQYHLYFNVIKNARPSPGELRDIFLSLERDETNKDLGILGLLKFFINTLRLTSGTHAAWMEGDKFVFQNKTTPSSTYSKDTPSVGPSDGKDHSESQSVTEPVPITSAPAISSTGPTPESPHTTTKLYVSTDRIVKPETNTYQTDHKDIYSQVPETAKVPEKMSTDGGVYVTDTISPISTLKTESTKDPDKVTLADIDSAHSYNYRLLLQDMKQFLFFVFNDNALKTMIKPRGLIRSFNTDETYYTFLIEYLNLDERKNESKDAFDNFFATFYNHNSTVSIIAAKKLFNQIIFDLSDMLTARVLINLKNEIRGSTTNAHLLKNVSIVDMFNVNISSHENGHVKKNIGLDYLLQVFTEMENSSTLEPIAYEDQSGNSLSSQTVSKYLVPLRNALHYIRLNRNNSTPADGIFAQNHLLNVLVNKQTESNLDSITSIVRTSLMSRNVTRKISEQNDTKSHQFTSDTLWSPGNLPNIFDGKILLDIFFNMQHIRKRILGTGKNESETKDESTKDSVRKQRYKSQAKLFLHLLKNKAVNKKMTKIFPEQDLTHEQVTALKSVYVLNSMLMRSKDVAEVGYMLMHADTLSNGTLLRKISGAFFDTKVSEIIASIEDATQKRNVVQIVQLLQTWKLLEEAIEEVAKPYNLPRLYNRLSIWKMFYILHLMESRIQKADASYNTTPTFGPDLGAMSTFSEDLSISSTMEALTVSEATYVFSTDVASSTYHHTTMHPTPESIISTSKTFLTDSTATASKDQIETSTHMTSVEVTIQSQPYSETTPEFEEIYERNYSVILRNMIQMLQLVKNDMLLKHFLEKGVNISVHPLDKTYLEFLIFFLPVSEFLSANNLTNNLDERSFFNKTINDVLDITEERLHIGNLIHVLNLINNGTLYDLNNIFNNRGTNQAKWMEDDELIRWTIEELLLILNMSIQDGISLELFLNRTLANLAGGHLSEEIFLEVLGLVRNVTSLPADYFINMTSTSYVDAHAKFDLWDLLHITRFLENDIFKKQFIPDKVLEKNISSKEQLIKNLYLILNSLEHGHTNYTNVFGEFKHLTSDQIDLLNLVYTLNMVPNGTFLKTSSFSGFDDTFFPLQRRRNLQELAYFLVIMNGIQMPKLIQTLSQIPLNRNIDNVIESTEDLIQRKNLQDILHLIRTWSSFRDTNINIVIGNATSWTDDSGSDKAFWDMLYILHLIQNWRITEESNIAKSVVFTTSFPANKTGGLPLTTETGQKSTDIDSQSTLFQDGSTTISFEVSSVTSLPTSSWLTRNPTEALTNKPRVSSTLRTTDEMTQLETLRSSNTTVSTEKYVTQRKHQTASLASGSTTESKSEKSTVLLQSSTSTSTASVIFNETTEIPFETTTEIPFESTTPYIGINRIKGKLDNVIHLLQLLANDNTLKGYLRKNIGMKGGFYKTSFLEFLNLLLSIDKHKDTPNELLSHYFVKHRIKDELASASVFDRNIGDYFNLTRDTFRLKDLIYIMNLVKNGTLLTEESQVQNKTKSEDEPFSIILDQLKRFINITRAEDLGVGYTPVEPHSTAWNITVDQFDMGTVLLFLNLIPKWSFPLGFKEETFNARVWEHGSDETDLLNLLFISRLMHNDMFKNTTVYDRDIGQYDSSRKKLIERIFVILKSLENNIVNGTNLVAGTKNFTTEQLRFLNLIYALNTIQNETFFEAFSVRDFYNLPPLNRPRSVNELAYLLIILDNIQDRKPIHHRILFDRDIGNAIESIDNSVQRRNLREVLDLLRTLEALKNTNVFVGDATVTDDYDNGRTFWNLLYLLHLTQSWRITDESRTVTTTEFTSSLPTFQTKELPLPTEATTAEAGKGNTDVDSQTTSFYDDLTSISFEIDADTISTTSWLMTGTDETFTDREYILSTPESGTEQRTTVIESVSVTTEPLKPTSAKEHTNTTIYLDSKSFNTMTTSTETTTLQVEPTTSSSVILNETTEASFISTTHHIHVKETNEVVKETNRVNRNMDDMIYLLQLLANDDTLKSHFRKIEGIEENFNQTSFIEFLNRLLSVNYGAKKFDETFSHYFVKDRIRNELASASVFNRSIGEYFDLTNDTYDIGDFINIMNIWRNGTIFTETDRVQNLTDSKEAKEMFRWILDVLFQFRNVTQKGDSSTGYISDNPLTAAWNNSRFNMDTTLSILSLIPGWSSPLGFNDKTLNMSLFNMRGVGKENGLPDLLFISHLMQTELLKNKTIYESEIENYDLSQKKIIERLLLILDSSEGNFISEANSIPKLKTLTKDQLELLNLVYFLSMVQNETFIKYSNESKVSGNQIPSQRPRRLRELAYLLAILESMKAETLPLVSKGFIDIDIDHAIELVENAFQRKDMQEILHLIRAWVIFKDGNISKIVDRNALSSGNTSTSKTFWNLLYVLHLIQNWRLTQGNKGEIPIKLTTLKTEEAPKTTSVSSVTTEQVITETDSQSTAFQDYFTEEPTTAEDITTVDKEIVSTTEALISANLDVTETYSTNIMTTGTEQKTTTSMLTEESKEFSPTLDATSTPINHTMTLKTASETTTMPEEITQEITEFDIESTTFQDNLTSTSFEIVDDTTIPTITQQKTESTDRSTESTTVLQSSIATTDTKAGRTMATVMPTEESEELTTVKYTIDLTEELSSTIEATTILPQTEAGIIAIEIESTTFQDDLTSTSDEILDDTTVHIKTSSIESSTDHGAVSFTLGSTNATGTTVLESSTMTTDFPGQTSTETFQELKVTNDTHFFKTMTTEAETTLSTVSLTEENEDVPIVDYNTSTTYWSPITADSSTFLPETEPRVTPIGTESTSFHGDLTSTSNNTDTLPGTDILKSSGTTTDVPTTIMTTSESPSTTVQDDMTSTSIEILDDRTLPSTAQHITKATDASTEIETTLFTLATTNATDTVIEGSNTTTNFPRRTSTKALPELSTTNDGHFSTPMTTEAETTMTTSSLAEESKAVTTVSYTTYLTDSSLSTTHSVTILPKIEPRTTEISIGSTTFQYDLTTAPDDVLDYTTLPITTRQTQSSEAPSASLTTLSTLGPTSTADTLQNTTVLESLGMTTDFPDQTSTEAIQELTANEVHMSKTMTTEAETTLKTVSRTDNSQSTTETKTMLPETEPWVTEIATEITTFQDDWNSTSDVILDDSTLPISATTNATDIWLVTNGKDNFSTSTDVPETILTTVSPTEESQEVTVVKHTTHLTEDESQSTTYTKTMLTETEPWMTEIATESISFQDNWNSTSDEVLDDTTLPITTQHISQSTETSTESGPVLSTLATTNATDVWRAATGQYSSSTTKDVPETTHLTDESQITTMSATNLTESIPGSIEIALESTTFQDDMTTTSIAVLNDTIQPSTLIWDDLTSTYNESTLPTTSQQITPVSKISAKSTPIVSTFATTHASEHTQFVSPVTYTTYLSYNKTEEEQTTIETATIPIFTEQDITDIDSETTTFQEEMTSTSVEIFDDTTLHTTETPTENNYVVSTIPTTTASKNTTVRDSSDETTTDTYVDYLTSTSSDMVDDITLPTTSSTNANDRNVQDSSSTTTDVPKQISTSEDIKEITTISEIGVITRSDSILTTKLSEELTTLSSTSQYDFATLSSPESNDTTEPTVSFSPSTQKSTDLNPAINITGDANDRRFVNFLRIILYMKRNRHILNEMILRYLKEQRERGEFDSPRGFNGSMGGIFDFTEGNIDIGDLLYVMNLVSNGTIYMDKTLRDVMNRSGHLKDNRGLANDSLNDLLFILNKTMSTESHFGNIHDGTINGFNLSFWDQGGQMGDDFGVMDLLYISHLMKQGIVKQQQNVTGRETDEHGSKNGLLMKNIYLILQSLQNDAIPDSEINRVFAVRNATTDLLEWLKLIHILNFVQNRTVLETSNMTGYIDIAQKPLQHIRSLHELAHLLIILNNIQEGRDFMTSNRALQHGDIDDAVNSVDDIVQRHNLQDILFLIRTWIDLKNKNENMNTTGSPSLMDNYRSFWDLLNMMHLIQNWRYQRDIREEGVTAYHPTLSTSNYMVTSTKAQIKLDPLTPDTAVTTSENQIETTIDLLNTDTISTFTLEPLQTSESVNDIIVTTPMTTDNTTTTSNIETVETSSAKALLEQVTHVPQTTTVFTTTTIDPDYNYLWYLSMSDLKKLFPGGVDLKQPDEEWTKHTDHPENGTVTDHRNVSTQSNTVKENHTISAGHASNIEVINTTFVEPGGSNNVYKSVINETLATLVDGILPNISSTYKRDIIHILLNILQLDRNRVSKETYNFTYVSNLLDDKINRNQLQYLLSIISLLNTAQKDQLLKLNAATEPTDWNVLLQLLQNSTQYISIGDGKPDDNFASTNTTDLQKHLKYVLNSISLNNEIFSRAQDGNQTLASVSHNGLYNILQLLFKLSGADLFRHTSNLEKDTSSKQRSFTQSLLFRYNKTQWQNEIRSLLMDKLQSAQLDGASFKLGDVMFIMNLLTYIANTDTITREESLPLLIWLDRWLHSDNFTFDSFKSGTDHLFASNFSTLFNTFRGMNPTAWLYILRQIENLTASDVETNIMNMGIDLYLLRDIFRLLDQQQNTTRSKELPLHISGFSTSSGPNATKDRPQKSNTTRVSSTTTRDKLGYLPFLLIWNQSDPLSRDGIKSFVNMTDPNILFNMLKLFGKKPNKGNDQSGKTQSDTLTQQFNTTTDMSELLSLFALLQNMTAGDRNANFSTSSPDETTDRQSDMRSVHSGLHMLSNASGIEDMIRLFYRMSGNTTTKINKTYSDINLLKKLYQYVFLFRNGSSTAKSDYSILKKIYQYLSLLRNGSSQAGIDLENMFPDGTLKNQQSISTLLELMKIFGNGSSLFDRQNAEVGKVTPGERIVWRVAETMPLLVNRTRMTNVSHSNVKENTTEERGTLADNMNERIVKDGKHIMLNASRIEDMIRLFYRISGNTTTQANKTDNNNLLKTFYQYLLLLRNGTDDSSAARSYLENMLSSVNMTKQGNIEIILRLMKMFGNGTLVSDTRKSEVGTDTLSERIVRSLSEIMLLLVNGTRMTKEGTVVERGVVADDTAEKRGDDKTETKEARTDTMPTPTGDLHMYQGDTNGSEIELSDATRVWGMVEANRPLTLVWEMSHVTGWEQVRVVRRFSNGTVEHIGTVSARDLVPRGSTGSLRISRRSRFHDDKLEVVVALAMFTCRDEASYNINVTFASGATMWRQDQIFVYGQAVARLVTPPDLFEADGLGGVQCHATLGYPERELYFRLQTQTDSKPHLLMVDPSAYNVTSPAACDREVTVNLDDVLEPETKFDRAVVQCGLLAKPRPGPQPPQGRWVASSPTVITIIPDSVCPDNQSRVPHPSARCNFIDCRHKMVMVCPDNTCFSPALGYCAPLTT